MKFPPAWGWLVDEAIPAYVKKTYSPKESWKDKPFSDVDAEFFFRGTAELSDLFTDERPDRMPEYFRHPKFRSGYLLYFLPLQAAKFLTLLSMHRAAALAALDHGRKTGTLRIVDLGAGPLTASLAFLLWLLAEPEASQAHGPLPKIEIIAWDTHRGILDDGRTLALELSRSFPRLRDRVEVITRVGPWDLAPQQIEGEVSLVLLGHVLNEQARKKYSTNSIESTPVLPEAATLIKLWPKIRGGGVLLVEPASRGASQHLSILRDELFETKTLIAEPSTLWGPCLHAGRCPLATGKDWCHFSVPIAVPGKWFAKYSRKLGGGKMREWIKFSYLWINADSVRGGQRLRPTFEPDQRRVVSDPIRRIGERNPFVMICEPERTERISIRGGQDVHRGDLISLKDFSSMDSQKPVRFRRDQAPDQAPNQRLGKKQRERLKKRTIT